MPIIVCLLVLGICFGSFINAFVWRLHEQERELHKHKPDKTYLKRLSIMHGRSMCPHCHHELVARDLIPVVSWLSLKGKCRYCKHAIPDSPVVELITALLFVASYIWWPATLNGSQVVLFVLWLIILIGLVILTVYDLRWLLLPNKVVYPLIAIAIIQAVITLSNTDHWEHALLLMFLSVLVGGGIFYLLYQISDGRWIGGGDVKLGWLLGILVATPARSFLFIFIAALAGCAVALPLLINGRLKRTTMVPFGPFLIFGSIVVLFFGANILAWYEHLVFITH